MTGSVWWRQGIEYRDRCEQVRLQYEQIIETLQKRLADAVAVPQAIERHETGSDDGFEKISEHGDWVLFEDLKPVRDILTGNDSRESESER